MYVLNVERSSLYVFGAACMRVPCGDVSFALVNFRFMEKWTLHAALPPASAAPIPQPGDRPGNAKVVSPPSQLLAQRAGSDRKPEGPLVRDGAEQDTSEKATHSFPRRLSSGTAPGESPQPLACVMTHYGGLTQESEESLAAIELHKNVQKVKSLASEQSETHSSPTAQGPSHYLTHGRMLSSQKKIPIIIPEGSAPRTDPKGPAPRTKGVVGTAPDVKSSCTVLPKGPALRTCSKGTALELERLKGPALKPLVPDHAGETDEGKDREACALRDASRDEQTQPMKNMQRKEEPSPDSARIKTDLAEKNMDVRTSDMDGS